MFCIHARSAAIPECVTISGAAIIIRVAVHGELASELLVRCLTTAGKFTVVSCEAADTACYQGCVGNICNSDYVRQVPLLLFFLPVKLVEQEEEIE